jgi:hypothetical protein
MVLVDMVMLGMRAKVWVEEEQVMAMTISQPIQGDRTQPPFPTGMFTAAAEEEDLDIKRRFYFDLIRSIVHTT